jgi:hypothetical protein
LGIECDLRVETGARTGEESKGLKIVPFIGPPSIISPRMEKARLEKTQPGMKSNDSMM